MLLAATTPAHSHRAWNRGFPGVQRRHLSVSCKRWVAEAAGQPDSSRQGEGAGLEGSSGSGLSSSSSSSSSSDELAVAAVLASAGLNPAELQQQAPAAYSQLSLQLAQVLAEVHVGWAASIRGTRVPAAELLARICFLAWEVGLTADEVRDGHRSYRKLLSFTLDGARQLRSWLRMQQVNTDQLRLASRTYSSLWSVDIVKLQRSKEHVQQQLAVTDRQWCKAFTTSPHSVRAASPDRLDAVIAWLEAKPLGLSREKMAQLWLTQPALFAVSSDVLQLRLGQLISRFSLAESDMRRVLYSGPPLLARDSETLFSDLDSLLAAEPCLRTSIPWLLCNGGSVLVHSTESLLSKVKSLRQYGFGNEQLSRVLSRNYMVLTSNLEDNVKPTLAALQSVLGSQEGVVAAVAKAPNLLSSAVETIEGNMEVMQKLGLSSADIKKSVRRQPQLFAFDYNNEDFQDKVHYYEAVLGRSPRHLLLEQPSILMNALKKVDYRVHLSFMELKGDTHHKDTLSWIYWTDKQFCEENGYSLTEFVGWRGQWVCSERARLYRLDKAKEPGISRALRARERRGRAKVAARREEVLAAGDEQG